MNIPYQFKNTSFKNTNWYEMLVGLKYPLIFQGFDFIPAVFDTNPHWYQIFLNKIRYFLKLPNFPPKGGKYLWYFYPIWEYCGPMKHHPFYAKTDPCEAFRCEWRFFLIDACKDRCCPYEWLRRSAQERAQQARYDRLATSCIMPSR